MKYIKSKELKGCYSAIPDTALEAVESLELFFNADIWYAKGAEWKTETECIKYMESHFKICKDQIKAIVSGEVAKINSDL